MNIDWLDRLEERNPELAWFVAWAMYLGAISIGLFTTIWLVKQLV